MHQRHRRQAPKATQGSEQREAAEGTHPATALQQIGGPQGGQTADAALSLQRSLGNRAVARLVPPGGVIQRNGTAPVRPSTPPGKSGTPPPVIDTAAIAAAAARSIATGTEAQFREAARAAVASLIPSLSKSLYAEVKKSAITSESGNIVTGAVTGAANQAKTDVEGLGGTKAVERGKTAQENVTKLAQASVLSSAKEKAKGASAEELNAMAVPLIDDAVKAGVSEIEGKLLATAKAAVNGKTDAAAAQTAAEEAARKELAKLKKGTFLTSSAFDKVVSQATKTLQEKVRAKSEEQATRDKLKQDVTTKAKDAATTKGAEFTATQKLAMSDAEKAATDVAGAVVTDKVVTPRATVLAQGLAGGPADATAEKVVEDAQADLEKLAKEAATASFRKDFDAAAAEGVSTGKEERASELYQQFKKEEIRTGGKTGGANSQKRNRTVKLNFDSTGSAKGELRSKSEADPTEKGRAKKILDTNQLGIADQVVADMAKDLHTVEQGRTRQGAQLSPEAMRQLAASKTVQKSAYKEAKSGAKGSITESADKLLSTKDSSGLSQQESMVNAVVTGGSKAGSELSKLLGELAAAMKKGKAGYQAAVAAAQKAAAGAEGAAGAASKIQAAIMQEAKETIKAAAVAAAKAAAEQAAAAGPAQEAALKAGASLQGQARSDAIRAALSGHSSVKSAALTAATTAAEAEVAKAAKLADPAYQKLKDAFENAKATHFASVQGKVSQAAKPAAEGAARAFGKQQAKASLSNMGLLGRYRGRKEVREQAKTQAKSVIGLDKDVGGKSVKEQATEQAKAKASDKVTAHKGQLEQIQKSLGQQKNMASAMTVFGTLIDAIIPNAGEQAELSIEFVFPVYQGLMLGFRVTAWAARDDSFAVDMNSHVNLIIAGGASAEQYAGAKVGGFFATRGHDKGNKDPKTNKSSDRALALLSYALFQQARDSILPERLVNFIWGSSEFKQDGQTNNEARAISAEAWALSVEESMTKDEYAEIGAEIGARGKGKVGIAEGEFDVALMVARRYGKVPKLKSDGTVETVTKPDKTDPTKMVKKVVYEEASEQSFSKLRQVLHLGEKNVKGKQSGHLAAKLKVGLGVLPSGFGPDAKFEAEGNLGLDWIEGLGVLKGSFEAAGQLPVPTSNPDVMMGMLIFEIVRSSADAIITFAKNQSSSGGGSGSKKTSSSGGVQKAAALGQIADAATGLGMQVAGKGKEGFGSAIGLSKASFGPGKLESGTKVKLTVGLGFEREPSTKTGTMKLIPVISISLGTVQKKELKFAGVGSIEYEHTKRIFGASSKDGLAFLSYGQG